MRKILICLLRRALWRLAPRFESIHFLISDGTTTHKAKHMQTTIPEKTKFLLTIALASAAGNPVAPQAVPAWSSSDESILTVQPAADGLTAEVFSTGAVGTATISVTADNLTATDEITVVAGPAEKLTLTAGTPEAIPPAAPVATDPVVDTVGT